MSDWGVTAEERRWLQALRGEQGEACQTEALRRLLGEEPPAAAEGATGGGYRLHDDGPVVCYWQVSAGVVPGFVDPRVTRQFCMTAAELAALDDAGRQARFRQLAAYAQAYFQESMDPETTNWAALEWFWL